MPPPLEGRVAVVTGASRGIGRALAVALAESGADVAVVARTVAPRGGVAGTIHETAAEVRELGRRCVPVAADMSVADDIDALAERVVRELGHVDLLVNNAAAMDERMFDGFWEMSAESWQYQIGLNLNSCWLAAKAFAPHLKDRGGGLIVNVTSATGAGRRNAEVVGEGARVGAAYLVSKTAVNRLTEVLAEELRPDGIGVVGLHPGHTRTENAVRIGRVGGFDLSKGHGVEVPAAALAHLAAADPLARTGAIVYAPELVGEHGLPAS